MTSPLTPDRLLNSLELTSFYLVKIVDPGLSPDPETSFKSRALEQLWFLRYFLYHVPVMLLQQTSSNASCPKTHFEN